MQQKDPAGVFAFREIIEPTRHIYKYTLNIIVWQLIFYVNQG